MKDRLTASDIKKMEEEIEYRTVTLRPELLEHVKVARAQGDLSENFEYKVAKQEKNRNESRIRYLEKMIKTAVVIDDSSADDEVGINNTITVEFCDDHSTASYKIVTTIRSNSLKGLISIESPLGKALMGHRVGDKVKVVVDDKTSYEVLIKEIDKSTDDSQDTIRQY
ncbi:MAG: transcription elongation factor GreA [Lachnospiraceae bacterium]|nr:transcription elongation factor GreA [Lachnospiraceae bacterium]